MLDMSTFAVIVRDLNLSTAERRRTLQQFSTTSPELLRRTIVMTTAPARAETVVAPGTVFAIVRKPFDIDELVDAVRACARGSREADRATARPTPSPRRSRESEPQTDASVKLDSLQRFVMSVPILQHLLSVPVGGQQEAALRAEMRRTLGALATTLTEASHVEASRSRAAVFRAASMVAGRLATVPPAGTVVAASGRDH